MLRRWLHRRRAARERIEREADNLITFMGAGSYWQARDTARTRRAAGDREGARHWDRVAVLIRDKTGLLTGLSSGDKYLMQDEDWRRLNRPKRRWR